MNSKFVNAVKPVKVETPSKRSFAKRLLIEGIDAVKRKVRPVLMAVGLSAMALSATACDENNTYNITVIINENDSTPMQDGTDVDNSELNNENNYNDGTGLNDSTDLDDGTDTLAPDKEVYLDLPMCDEKVDGSWNWCEYSQDLWDWRAQADNSGEYVVIDNTGWTILKMEASKLSHTPADEEVVEGGYIQLGGIFASGTLNRGEYITFGNGYSILHTGNLSYSPVATFDIVRNNEFGNPLNSVGIEVGDFLTVNFDSGTIGVKVNDIDISQGTVTVALVPDLMDIASGRDYVLMEFHNLSMDSTVYLLDGYTLSFGGVHNDFVVVSIKDPFGNEVASDMIQEGSEVEITTSDNRRFSVAVTNLVNGYVTSEKLASFIVKDRNYTTVLKWVNDEVNDIGDDSDYYPDVLESIEFYKNY